MLTDAVPKKELVCTVSAINNQHIIASNERNKYGSLVAFFKLSVIADHGCCGSRELCFISQSNADEMPAKYWDLMFTDIKSTYPGKMLRATIIDKLHKTLEDALIRNGWIHTCTWVNSNTQNKLSHYVIVV